MASKGKNTYTTRFEFSDTQAVCNETGTIKQLLEEINKENRPQDRERSAEDRRYLGKVKRAKIVDNENLNTVRDGILKIINRKVTTRTTHKIPLSELKTIYLLYRYNDDNDLELFGRLEPPQLNKPSLEFRTEGDALGNENYIPIFNHLQAQFSKEIDKDRLSDIRKKIPTRDIMLLEIEHQNAEISQNLRGWLQGDSDAVTLAYQVLTQAIDEFPTHSEPPVNPLHEAIYTHIRTLPFQHYVCGFEAAIQKACSNITIACILPELINFCQGIGEEIHPLLSKVTSIDRFEEFVAKYSKELINLIQKATGQETDTKQFKSAIEPARRILNVLSEVHYRKDNDTKSLSLLDCIGALCTSRFQVGKNAPQKIYDQPYWAAQPTQGKNLVHHLHTDRAIEDLHFESYIPHSVLQILYHRFGFITSALIHSTSLHKAYMDFQIAKQKKYVELLKPCDVDTFVKSINALELHIKLTLMRLDPKLQLPESALIVINRWLSDSVQ